MKDTLNAYVEKIKRMRDKRRKMISALCILSLLVATGVVWQLRIEGITMNDEACCGKIEHVHTEQCIAEKHLICGFEEDTEDPGAVCPLEEHTHTDECYTIEQVLNCTEDHEHTDACYTEEKTLVCDKPEHTHDETCETTIQEDSKPKHVHTEACYKTVYSCGFEEEHIHTLACYNDPSADVETAAAWEATLPAEGTGVWADDLIAVAQSQLGYQESTRNFLIMEDGKTTKGYTRYGAWYGNAYGDWCAMFASFCLYYAGIPSETVPYGAGCYAWMTELSQQGLFRAAENYTPATGDILFYDWDGDKDPDHVGIVSDVTKNENGSTVVSTIEGNIDDAVCLRAHELPDETIMGYGTVSKAQRVGITYGAITLAETGLCTIENCTLDEALNWIPSSAGNPLGGAASYNLFLFGNLEDWNDTEGNVALQGNLAKRNGGMTYYEGATNTSTGNPIPRFEVGLLLGGGLTDGLSSVNILNGSVICKPDQAIQGSSVFGIHTNGHIHGSEADAIDSFFTAAKNDLVKWNGMLYGISPVKGSTEIIEEPNGGITLKGNDQFQNIFHLSPEQYAAVGNGARNVHLDVPYGSYVVINIDGGGQTEITDFAPLLWTKNSEGEWTDPSDNTNNNQSQSQRILFNFDPSITKVTLNTGFYLYGSVLAPNMRWEIGSAQYVGVDGTAVLQSAFGNGTSSEFHYNPFIPWGGAEFTKQVVCDSCTTEEEKASCPICQVEDWSSYFVRIKLQEVADKGGNQATYTLEFPVTEKLAIDTLTPSTYRVIETKFYQQIDGKEIEVEFKDHSFAHVTFSNASMESDTVTVPSGGKVYLEITNHYKTGQVTQIKVRKLWRSGAGANIVPTETSIWVQLYKTNIEGDVINGIPVLDEAGQERIVELKKETGWYYAWYDMPKFEEDGITPIYYYVRELGLKIETGKYEKVPGYNVEYGSSGEVDRPITGGDYVITNRKTFAVKVVKKWVDNDGNTIWPSDSTSVKVQLMRTINTTINENTVWEKVGSQVQLNTSNLWKYYWENLPEKDENGKTYTYTVKEVDVPDRFTVEYTPKLAEGGISADSKTDTVIITNKKQASNTITVNKQWENPSDATSYVWVQLYQGKQQDPNFKVKFGDPIKLSADNGWSYTWDDLPKGTEWPWFTYFVEELPIPGYEVGYDKQQGSYLQSGTITVTNKKKENSTGLSVYKQWENTDGSLPIDPPVDGIQVQLYQQMGALCGKRINLALSINGVSLPVQAVLAGDTVTFDISFCVNERNYTERLMQSIVSGFTLNNVVYVDYGCYEGTDYYKYSLSGTTILQENQEGDMALSITLPSDCKMYGGSNKACIPQYTIFNSEGAAVDVEWEVNEEGNPVLKLMDEIGIENPVLLNNANKWYYSWNNLPKQNEDGTEFYRYYIREIGEENYTVLYMVNGQEYCSIKNGTSTDEILEIESMPGVTEGMIIITNRSKENPSYELPETGGTGTTLYTIGGLLMIVASLIFGDRRRRRERGTER